MTLFQEDDYRQMTAHYDEVVNWAFECWYNDTCERAHYLFDLFGDTFKVRITVSAFSIQIAITDGEHTYHTRYTDDAAAATLTYIENVYGAELAALV